MYAIRSYYEVDLHPGIYGKIRWVFITALVGGCGSRKVIPLFAGSLTAAAGDALALVVQYCLLV